MAASALARNVTLRLQQRTLTPAAGGAAAFTTTFRGVASISSAQQPRRILSGPRRPFHPTGKVLSFSQHPVRAFSTSTSSAQQPAAPEAAPAASESSPPASETSQPEVLIYNMEVSTDCQLVRALLRYLRVPYFTVEVNPLTNEPLHEVNGRTISDLPIVLIDGVKVAGTQTILRYILWWAKSKKLIPEAKLEHFVGQSTAAWTPPRDLGDGKFDVSGITFSPQIQESLGFLETHLAPTLWPWMAPSLGGAEGLMNYSHDVLHWTPFQRYMVSVRGAFWMRNQVRQLRKRLGVRNRIELEAFVRKHQAAWAERVEAHAPGGAHHGGQDPDLADLYMYALTHYLDFHNLNDYKDGRFGQLADNTHWALRRDTRVGRIPSKTTRHAPRFNMYTAEGEMKPLLWPWHPSARQFLPLFILLALIMAPGMYIHRQLLPETITATEGYENYEQQGE